MQLPFKKCCKVLIKFLKPCFLISISKRKMSQSFWVTQLKIIHCVPIMSGTMLCSRDPIVHKTVHRLCPQQACSLFGETSYIKKDNIQIYSYTQQLRIGRSLGSVSTHNRTINLVLGRGQGYSQRKASQRKLSRKGGKEQEASRINSCSQPSNISWAPTTCQTLS